MCDRGPLFLTIRRLATVRRRIISQGELPWPTPLIPITSVKQSSIPILQRSVSLSSRRVATPKLPLSALWPNSAPRIAHVSSSDASSCSRQISRLGRFAPHPMPRSTPCSTWSWVSQRNWATLSCARWFFRSKTSPASPNGRHLKSKLPKASMLRSSAAASTASLPACNLNNLESTSRSTSAARNSAARGLSTAIPTFASTRSVHRTNSVSRRTTNGTSTSLAAPKCGHT